MHRAPVVLFLALLTVPTAGWAQGGHRHRSDTPIGPEFLVNSFTVGNQGAPSTAFRPEHVGAGPFLVVWESDGQDGSGLGTFGKLSNVGSEFRINTYTTGNQDQPSVAMDSAGNFVVVWASGQDGSGLGVVGQRFDVSGNAVGPEFPVNSYTTNNQFEASVATDSAGNFVVVWSSVGQDGLGVDIFGQRYASTGVPQGPEFRVNTYTTGYQYRAAVSADSLGGFVVVWQDGLLISGEGSLEGRGIFGQRHAGSGVPLGGEFQVDTYTTGRQGNPSVAVQPGGSFVVVWQSDGQDGSNLGIFGQRYASSGASFGPEFRVNTYTTGAQGFPAIASDNAGCFLVAWHSVQDGSGAGVYGQLYYLGIPNDPEWRFNSYTTLHQTRPSIAGMEGGFVVTWQSQGQDGSGYGVYGQQELHFIPVELMQFQVE